MPAFFDIMISQPLNTFVIDWANRVKKNGGDTPSLQTLTALDRFYNGLVYTDLSRSMVAVNAFVPDSIIAASTPFFKGTGVDPWTRTGFTAAHLSTLGLQGAAGRYFDLGVNPSTTFAGSLSSSAGMTVYCTAGNINAENDMGIWIASGTPVFGLYISFNNQCFWDCWDAGAGRILSSVGAWTGFYSSNRISMTDTRIDIAKSTTAYHTVVRGVVLNTMNAPNSNIRVFRQNGSTTACTKRFSFAAVHSGLDSGSCQTFYGLVQQLRIDLGGGYL